MTTRIEEIAKLHDEVLESNLDWQHVGRWEELSSEARAFTVALLAAHDVLTELLRSRGLLPELSAPPAAKQCARCKGTGEASIRLGGFEIADSTQPCPDCAGRAAGSP